MVVGTGQGVIPNIAQLFLEGTVANETLAKEYELITVSKNRHLQSPTSCRIFHRIH